MVHRLQGGACWIRTELSPLPELEVNKGKKHWLKCTNVFCPNARLASVLSFQRVERGLNIARGKQGGRLGKGLGFSLSPQSSIAFPSFSLTLAPYDSTCSPLSDCRKRPIRQKIERCDFRSLMSLGVLISKYVDLLMSIRRCISCRAFHIALSALLAKNREIKRSNEVP